MADDAFDDEDPLWRRILFNEFLWAVIAIFVVLFVAFHFATDKDPTEDEEAIVEPLD